jgi:putative serine protease PepD
VPTDDPDDDAGDFEPPLPPEDRLWRHPSELGAAAARGPRIELVTRPATGRLVLLGLLTATAGSMLTLAVLVAVGAFDRQPAPTAIERYATELRATSGADTLETATPALPSVVRVEAWGPVGVRNGTALIVRDDGYLLATSDVVDGAETLQVWFDDGTTEPASLVGRDRDSDLSVLKIERTGLTAAVLREGHTAGHLPFGSGTVLIDAAPAGGPTPAVLEGFVSDPSREVTGDQGVQMFGMVEVSTRPQATGSGTGRVLVDDAGVVVGIVTGRGQPGPASPESDGLVLQFAVPIDHAKRVFDELASHGHVTRPVLGVEGVTDLSADEAETLGVTGGLRVDAVVAGGPAEAAGLRSRDVITRFEGAPVQDVNDLHVLLRRHAPGDGVAITYVRDGERNMALAVLDGHRDLP